MRRVEQVTLLKGVALAGGGPSTFTDPLDGGGGQGWYSALLRIAINLVVGTGTGAIAEGELKVIKSIYLKTDKGEVIINNIPARPMYDWARRFGSTPPQKDAIAAATATYYVNIPLVFADDSMLRPEDTVIDTSRYASMTMQIVMGGVSDLLTTVGTATVTFTADLVVSRSVGRLEPEALPVAHISYDLGQSIDATTAVKIKLDRGEGILIKRLLVFTGSGGNVSQPFSGTAVDSIIDTIEIEDSAGFPMRQQIWEILQAQNRSEYGFEALATGRAYLDFVGEDGSIKSAYDTDKKSKIDLQWVNKGALPGTPIVSVAVEQLRELAGA